MNAGHFACASLLPIGCSGSAQDARFPAAAIDPVADAEVELTLIQDGTTIKLVRRRVYRANPHSGRWDFVADGYDPDFYEKNYVEQEGAIFRKTENGKLYRVRHEFSDDFENAKPRLVVLTDIGGEADDQQSMVRLMLYSNEFEIDGLIASASGTPGELNEAVTKPQLIREIVDAFGEVRDNLTQHAADYPTVEYLRARIKSGNPRRGLDAIGGECDTEGSRWIIKVVDRPDDRPVNITIWGGRFVQTRDRVFRDAQDTVEGVTDGRCTVWRWRESFQRDFQARLDWCIQPRSKANHPPLAVCNDDATRAILAESVQPGSTLCLSAAGSRDPDDSQVRIRRCRCQELAGSSAHDSVRERPFGTVAAAKGGISSAGRRSSILASAGKRNEPAG